MDCAGCSSFLFYRAALGLSHYRSVWNIAITYHMRGGEGLYSIGKNNGRNEVDHGRFECDGCVLR